MFQHAKKVVSDSLGLVDFAIGLVNPVLNLPKGQVRGFWGNSIHAAHQKFLGGYLKDSWACTY